MTVWPTRYPRLAPIIEVPNRAILGFLTSDMELLTPTTPEPYERFEAHVHTARYPLLLSERVARNPGGRERLVASDRQVGSQSLFSFPKSTPPGPLPFLLPIHFVNLFEGFRAIQQPLEIYANGCDSGFLNNPK